MKSWFRRIPLLFKSSAPKVAPLLLKPKPSNIEQAWWGSYEVLPQQLVYWHIGNRIIGIQNDIHQWKIGAWYPRHFKIEPDELVNDAENSLNLHHEIFKEAIHHKTFVFNNLSQQIALKPVLADRPLVSRLQHPIYIPAEMETTLYASFPVSIRVLNLLPPIILDEISTTHLSDSWFGVNTLEGELCYGGNINCFANFKELPTHFDQVITRMHIKNHSHSTLVLDQITLPLPYLSVFTDKNHCLWTEQLIFKREGDNNLEVKIVKGPGRDLEEPLLLSAPRLDFSTSAGLKNFFNALIRN
ncbi:MAG: hypothetical protein JWM09_870 [Francisellaceae bacterium]|nr:hypothetical protein [Francisellaceae bacterium]